MTLLIQKEGTALRLEVRELADAPAMEDIFHRLALTPYSCFLDSSLIMERLGRYSFIGFRPPPGADHARARLPLVAARRWHGRDAGKPLQRPAQGPERVQAGGRSARHAAFPRRRHGVSLLRAGALPREAAGAGRGRPGPARALLRLLRPRAGPRPREREDLARGRTSRGPRRGAVRGGASACRRRRPITPRRSDAGGGALRLQLHPRRIHGGGAQGQGVHLRRRHLPGQPLPALPGPPARAPLDALPPAAAAQRGAVRRLFQRRGRAGVFVLAGAFPRR